MSGKHARHLGEDVRASCDECHAETVSSSTVILDPALHVDGDADTSFPSGMSFTGTTRTGDCHLQDRDRKRW